MISSFYNNQELRSKLGPNRAGVIPYTMKDHHIYFLLGIDRRTRELTDFGGGVKTQETILEGAYRELDEESCGIFSSVMNIEHLKHAPAITNVAQNTVIFFVRVDESWIEHAEKEFSIKQQQLTNILKHTELIGIKWIIDQDFKVIAFNRKSQCMWKRIQNLLRVNTTWSELRITLMLGPELTNAVRNSWNYLSRKNSNQQTVQQVIISQSC